MLAAIAVSASAIGCTPTHLVRPVGAGTTRLDVSLGGPLVELAKVPAPTPIASLSVAHGLREDLDLIAALPVTPMIYGVFGGTLGAAWHLRTSDSETFTVGGEGTFWASTQGDTAGWIDPWAAYAWSFPKEYGLAVGARSTVGFGTRVAYVPAPFIHGWKTIDKTTLELELRWMAPFDNTNVLAPGWIGAGGQGAFVVLLGAHWDIAKGGGL